MAHSIQKNEQGEVTTLDYRPEPEYRKVLNIISAVCALYLLLAFSGLFSSGGH